MHRQRFDLTSPEHTSETDFLDCCTLKKGLRKSKHVANNRPKQNETCLSDVTCLYLQQSSGLAEHSAAILTLNMKAAWDSETLASTYQTIRCHSQDYHNVQFQSTKHLKYSCFVELSGGFVTVIWCGVNMAGSLG